MRNIVLIIGFTFISIQVFGQRISNPQIRKSDVPYCKVVSIDLNQDNTTVKFNYTAPNTYVNGGWACAGDDFFIRDNETGTKYYLIKVNNIPICPQKHSFSRQGESLTFNLVFQPLPKTSKEIDIIENLTGGGFNYYGVNLTKNNTNTSTNSIKNLTNEQTQYSLTLTAEGKLKNEGDVLGDILYMIASGTTVGIYSKDKGYYKVNHNGNIGYLSDLYFNKNNPSTKSDQSVKKETQKKEIKSYYRDGKAFQYYVYNGISVTMHLSIEKNYGKYYIAYISIENLTGRSFNFNPDNIAAVFSKNGESIYGEVLSSSEYMRKVNNRQVWNAALVAFGESSAANQAGYSSSSTTSTTSGYSNTYGSASGYYGNTYGSLYGSSSTYGSATTKSTTQSYDGAANLAAQQNAQRNIANYQNQQYQIKSVLNEGYLKLNTLDNEQRMVGYVNVKYRSADKIKVIIPVNGVDYEFWWNNE